MRNLFSLVLVILLWLATIELLLGEAFPPLRPDGQPALFYIYEWPEELDDVYPPATNVLHPLSSYNHTFNENGGAGRLINSELGLFQTWQFSLYKNMMRRLRASRHRTRYLDRRRDSSVWFN
jgi:hypothetical protein